MSLLPVRLGWERAPGQGWPRCSRAALKPRIRHAERSGWQTVDSGCMSLLPDLHCVRDVRLHFAVAVSRQRHCANGPKRPSNGEHARREPVLGWDRLDDDTGEKCKLVT